MAVVTITKDNFMEEVLQSKETVLVDFWATWCGPCQMLGPVVDEIAEAGIEGLKVGKINIDEQSDLAEQYRVMTIPTLMIFKGGKPVNSSVGVIPKKKIMELIEKAK